MKGGKKVLQDYGSKAMANLNLSKIQNIKVW